MSGTRKRESARARAMTTLRRSPRFIIPTTVEALTSPVDASDGPALVMCKVAAKGKTYMLPWYGKHYQVPVSAIMSLPKRSNVLPNVKVLRRILAHNSPGMWLEYCSPETICHIQIGALGSCVYTTFTVEGHDDESRVLRRISSTVSLVNFPIWKARVEKKIADGDIVLCNARQKARAAVLSWTWFDCAPNLLMLNREIEKWTVLDKEEAHKRCFYNPKAAHDATVDHFNKLPLPSLAQLATELRTNPWLATVACRAAQHQHLGCNCADMSLASFDQDEDDDHLQSLGYDDLVSVVPHVRRLGYAVTLFSDKDANCPFNVEFPGKQARTYLCNHRVRLTEFEECGREYLIRLHGTAPAQVLRRGLLKCVPRLLGWLRQARIALADPRRPGAIEALAEERKAALAETQPPHWKSVEAEHATEQTSRKRKLVDALHCSNEDTRKGARWADIQVKTTTNPVSGKITVEPMRIEAVAGDHYVFQKCAEETGGIYDHAVVVLHRDTFTVEPLRPYSQKGTPAYFADVCEEIFARRFRGCGSDSDDDDDDDDE